MKRKRANNKSIWLFVPSATTNLFLFLPSLPLLITTEVVLDPLISESFWFDFVSLIPFSAVSRLIPVLLAERNSTNKLSVKRIQALVGTFVFVHLFATASQFPRNVQDSTEANVVRYCGRNLRSSRDQNIPLKMTQPAQSTSPKAFRQIYIQGRGM